MANQSAFNTPSSVQTKTTLTPPGNCLALDGSGDFITIPSANGINNQFDNNRITLEGWFYIKSLPTGSQAPALITENYNGVGGYNIKFAIYLYQNTIRAGHHNGNWTQAVYTNTPLNRWVHIACTYDQKLIKLYLDGDLVATQASTSALPLGSENWSLGKRWDYNEYFNGSMDEVRIYNEALTAEQVLSDLRDTSIALPNNLVAYYNFDQGVQAGNNTTITLLTDKGPNQYNGELYGLSLLGGNSNFVSSYAIVVPKANAASNILSDGFTANWEAPNFETINEYQIDISTTSDFTAPIAGSPFKVGADTFSITVSGLTKGYYYYRVRANSYLYPNQSATSKTITVLVPYEYSGNALDFDGVNDVVTLPVPNNLINSFTMEGWVYLNALTNNHQTLFAYGYDNGIVGNGMALYVNANGELMVQYPEIGQLYPGYIMPVNRWVHLALTRTGNVTRVYVNGVMLSKTGTTGPKGPSAEIRLGAHNGIRLMKGHLDEFRFWNYARSESQIFDGMKSKMDPTTTGLLRYYNFDLGVKGANNSTTNMVEDLTANKVNGTLNNFALSGTISNWVESYAMIVPQLTSATAVTPTGFTANYTAPANGIVDNYLVDVSSTSDMFSPVPNSPFSAPKTDSTKVVIGLTGGTHYLSVRANNSNLNNQGAYSNILPVEVPYTEPGNAIAFDGSNDYISSDGTNAGNFGTSNFTVEYWIKTNDNSAYHITKRGGCGGGSFWSIGHGIVGQTTDVLYIELNNGGSYPIVMHPKLARPINDGKWHHFALVREGLKLSVFVDGEFLASGQGTGIANPNNSGKLYIGKSTCNAPLMGSMDEVRLWTTARTLEQINAGMRAQIANNSIGLQALYKMDHGVGDLLNYDYTTVKDFTGNGNNCTLYNSALEALNSNWVQSYAMVVPTLNEPTDINPNGFTLSWTPPSVGVIGEYKVDISQNSNFVGNIPGSPFTVSGTSLTLSDLAPGRFYCRVRASLPGKLYGFDGGPSNVKLAKLEYTPPGNALHFDGNNDYGTINRQISDDFTIEYWLKTTEARTSSPSWARGIVDMEVGGASGDFINNINGGKIGFIIGSNGSDVTIQSVSTVNTGKWHHVAISRDRSSGLMRLYINGVLEATGTGGTGSISASSFIRLGANNLHQNDQNYSMAGALDELRIWNVVRTPAEIFDNFRDTVDRNSTGLVNYYNFDQGIGGGSNAGLVTLVDIAGADNGGTLSNLGLSGNTSNWIKSYEISVSAPSNLTVSTDNCSTIDLSWQIAGSLPTTNCDASINCGAVDFRQFIYLDDVVLAVLPYNTTSYSFEVNKYYNGVKLIRGVNYKFKIVTAYTPPLFNYVKESSPSNSAVGRFKPNPEIPSGFTTSLNKCDGSVDLGWVWSSINPSNGFVLNRSEDSTMSNLTTTVIAGTNRSYTDNGLQRGKYYYYRIFARNDCYVQNAHDTMFAGVSDTMELKGGISPSVPERPSNIRLFADSINNVITIRWNDNSNFEDKFSVERAAVGGGSASFETNPNDTVYYDDQAAGCTNYNYSVKVYSGCALNGVSSLGLNQTRLTPNLANTFEPNTIYKLKASKGYYPDRVELNWNNRNNGQLSTIRIYRKIAGTTNDSILINSVLSGSGLYVDNTTVAGVMYQYFLVGETQCAGVTRFSNMTSDIGFRSPSGIISGAITYAGGFAAEGIKVLAQNTSVNKGASMEFSAGSYISTPHQNKQNPSTGAITIESWFKPIEGASFVIASKLDSLNGGYSLRYDSAQNAIEFYVANATASQLVSAPNPFVSMTSYSQITAAYGADSIRVYINGQEAATVVNLLENGIGASGSEMYFGSNPGMAWEGKGILDEIRIWKISKTKAQILNDFNRTTDPNNGDLLLYYSFDDRFDGLSETYDASNKNLVFNENHATLVGGAIYSDSIPTSSQLSLASFTTSTGSYTIANVRYLGTGQNFNVVPSLDIHSFSPNNRVVFIGDGAQVLNNIDFTDNSSFEFVGRVTYVGTTCPAVGANVMIDGSPAVLNGTIVTVNDSGKFVIRVPIGNHSVELNQQGHTFSAGRFPPTGTYNFQTPANANFTDSTFLKVVGRVVGGNIELNKVPGLGRSKNNIGKAQFTFNSVGQSGLLGCYSKSIVTDDSTGEYIAYLLPLRYTIDGLRLVNNLDPTILTKDILNNPNQVDLSNDLRDTVVYDTLITVAFSKVDSFRYNRRLDFKYYEKPEIFFSTVDIPADSFVNNFIGEKSIKINDSISLSLLNNEMGYPIFKQAGNYSGVIKVIERYQNIDKPVSDLSRFDYVPVSGLLRINNSLASPSEESIEIQISNGILNYSFSGGVPNHLRNSLIPEYSYTKTLQISFAPTNGETVSFEPNYSDLNSKFYRGIVLGIRSGGNDFTTKGPSLVEFVLRDPPGSASSSTWSKETSYTSVNSYSFSKSFSQSLSAMWDFSVENIIVAAPLGVGKIENSTLTNNLTLGISFNQTLTNDGEMVSSTTYAKTISTGSDAGSVGASADIYFGTSRNMVFGMADRLELVDTQTCRLGTISAGEDICIGNEVEGHRIGKRTGFYIAPTDVATTFAYTQDEILNLIIPDLERLRNFFLLNDIKNTSGVRKYTPVFSDENDPDYFRKFGSNNDDPIWGGLRSTSTPYDREAKDSVGMSYLFRGNNIYEPDSIRILNEQIRLWKKAIADNEKAKYKAFNSSASAVAGGSNISIGKASVTEDFSTTQEETSTSTFELNFGQDISYSRGFKTSSIAGFELSGSISFEQNKGSSRSSTTSTTNTFSYTLQDGDDGDLISVDVVNPKGGGSHIFKLKAGKTACPYEGEERALFYSPDNDTITSTTLLEEGVILQAATAQNDVPLIDVQQKTIFNVPAEDQAVFVLELGNLSEGQQDRTYSLRVDQSTNPYGAIIKVDGLDPNRDFDVPYGTTLQKTLTIERGPINYDYNNIKLILKSSCDDDIFDTVSVSARFLPTCTGVEIKSPDDRWVLNNSFNDTLPILIGGYNYNYGGFQAVHFQYKPAAGNTWYTEKIFYKDTQDQNVQIPIGSPNIFYAFNMHNLPEGKYELRAVTECIAPGYPNSRINSTVLQGAVDRVNPSPFGTPSPGDGILSPNDDISIQFNEEIDQSTLSLSNFEVKGVLNKTALRSNSSLYLDGDNDYAEVPPGLSLQRVPFSMEMYFKRGALGNQVLLSQGADSAASFEFGFTFDDKLYFRVGEEMVTSNTAITDTVGFHFIAVAYNPETFVAELFYDNIVANIGNNRIFNPYEGSGKFYIGKAAAGAPRFTQGNMYELRLWSAARTLTDVNNTKSILLNGTESGLMGNWRMDEATGSELKDYARARNASIVNAQWTINPKGTSRYFDGSSFVTVPTNTFGISKEMDLTLEFWFKSNDGANVCMLSNGKGDGTDLNSFLKWSIETDAQGRIVVNHNGHSFLATSTNYFDGNWHHFALLLKRSSNLSCFVDGNLQNSDLASSFEQFGGLKLCLGARFWNNIGNSLFDSTDMHFTGNLDEVRIWQSSRLVEQIKRDKDNRLIGSETGLVLYLPFESYSELMGFPILTPTTLDLTSSGTRNFTSFAGSVFSAESPTMKLPRPVQDINFAYSVNKDKIIITPTTSNEFIENVTLDITVKNINDLNGNTMQSPKTWIAYMDRNQVKWQDENRTFVKESLVPLSFVAKIVNSGGALKEYNLSNLPSWLSASPSQGSISPNSTSEITFTLDPNINIGSYEADIALNTDFGFADKLLVKLKVNGRAPVWTVNPALYTKSMSVIGQVRINNIISSNTDDILAAFVGEECRGLAKVTYYSQLDKYLVFMDVYGVEENEQLEFRIWNSATGKTHVDVTPALQFQSNTLTGAVLNPQVFNALDKVNQMIVVKPGWNWISFNLLMNDSNDLGKVFNGVTLNTGAIIKNIDQLAVYDSQNGWSGNLANFSTGLKPEKSYLFYTQTEDTIIVKGVEANPQLRPIPINLGWNYVGYVGQRNMSVNDAFGAFGSKQNDLLKGQVQFAIYDTTLGWIGSLTALIPGKGYQYYSNGVGVLRYPRSAMFGKTTLPENLATSAYWKINPHTYEGNMNLIANVDVCEEVLQEGNLLLGAFVGSELRGFTAVKEVGSNQFSYFLTVAGNDKEVLNFKLLNEATGAVYELKENTNFGLNQLQGSLKMPMKFTSVNKIACVSSTKIESSLSVNLYPNPSQDKVNLSVSLPNEDAISIRVYDISGKQVMQKDMGYFAKGNYVLNLNTSELQEGIYLVEVTTSNENQRIKMIKIK
ncbi:MAG: T9SS type A sorting domain-containing protein [Bacteroidia bacterium]|nr:T9SS type A sorting domain-containing protein [Bacteroidia bacterium]